MSVLVLYLSMTLIGYAAGSKLRDIKGKLGWISRLQTAAILMLVFVMGSRMGANDDVIKNLGSIGLYAVAFTVVVMITTTVCVSVSRRIIGLDRYGTARLSSVIEDMDAEKHPDENKGKANGSTLKILISLSLGIITGYFFVADVFSRFAVFDRLAGIVIKIGLCIMLNIVGLDLGLDGTVVGNFKKVGVKIMAIPLATIVGTLAGAMICSLFVPISLKESLAVGAGFGWYSLAPGIIMEKGYMVTGAISFMHNIMRDVFAMVTIPVVASHIGYVECCGLPGAAAMDLCLPVVEHSTSSNIAVYSFVSGVTLTIIVPIIVPLILG